MSKSVVVRAGLGTIAVGVVLIAAAFWWVFLRDDTPPAAALVERAVVEPSADLDGTWAIEPGDEVFAGYRIDEIGATLHNTAVARTGEVEGELSIEGSKLTDAVVTADLASLVSQDNQLPTVGNRDRAMETAGLETDRFPTATFTLTSPVALGAPPAPGEEVSFEAEGELTLHGETRAVIVPFSARWNGEVIDVTASIDVALADYGIEQPAAQIVTVADQGTVELQLTFGRPT
jgi:polyisoprenoid-binding protein YceI